MSLTYTDVLVQNYATCTNSILTFHSLLTNGKVSFNAFLTDFDETLSSSWNVEEVYGRMDPIAQFRSTKRTISLAWVLPASSEAEAKLNLKKISGLSKMLYPTYANTMATGGGTGSNNVEDVTTASQQIDMSAHTQTLAKPPLVKVGFANLLQGPDGEGQLGWIDNFSFKPNLDMGFFIDSTKNLYPKAIQLSCNLNVLHQQSLGYNSSNNWMGSENFPFGPDSSNSNGKKE